MLDYDVVIVGGGPAGLSAGLRLSQAGCRTLVLERELFGGNLKHVERVDDIPEFGAPISGAQLASEMAERAVASGARLEETEVIGIETYSGTRWVACDGGRGYSTSVVIVASGCRSTKLGLPGEERLLGRGVIDCVPCDGGLFRGRVVAVYGSGDHALADALHLARLASKVILVTQAANLAGSEPLQKLVLGEPCIEVRPGRSLQAISGDEQVEAIVLSRTDNGEQESVAVDGVVIRIGTTPNTEFLEGMVELDANGQVVTDPNLDTSSPYVLAAGDVRRGAQPRVGTAITDGAAAARRAAEWLRELSRHGDRA
ncbi:MAG TPA: NAD(P)/FAD-dependent oxidoreductase [Candidatus Dormibacteraeota bacterium]|nr:NAD(P)/FAD-dependent oxidoreductase [Candidatus Dormibacteraeota bacterium]